MKIDARKHRNISPVQLVALLLFTSAWPVFAQEPDGSPAESARKAAWMNKLEPGLKRARETGRSVLLRFDDETCAYCRALDEQIETDEVQRELSNWLLIKVDIDDAPAAARRMRVTGVPALRVLSPIGRVVAQQDGGLLAEDLVTWLEETRAAGVMQLDEDLLDAGAPDILTVAAVSVYLGDRDVSLREAAIRRLAPWPNIAGKPIVESLADGSLATRLSAMELLTTWKAPLGNVDPWQPKSLSTEALGSLYAWADKQKPAEGAAAAQPKAITEAELQSLRSLIDRMLVAPIDEAASLAERIARGGEKLLPDVYQRLKTAESDADRQRLTALRYRLVADSRTALEWSAGINRLASTDLTTRKLAADELARTATAADERLLLELFSDPAPIVREISLRALNKIGSTSSDGALVKLLDDPEPNIRAAVLGLLAESPSKPLVKPIVKYVEKETDPDLVVHAVRFLREVKGEEAAKCLVTLLEHDNWRIRSEAAEAVGKVVGGSRYGNDERAITTELKAEVWAALVERLEDSDAFVVSRSAEALASASMPIVIDPLAAVVERHPSLGGNIMKTMASLDIDGRLAQTKINDHLVQFSTHEDATIRAAAVTAVAGRMKRRAQPELAKAILDADENVRVAAADAVFMLLGSEVSFEDDESDDGEYLSSDGFGEDDVIVVEESSLLGAAANAIKGIFGGGQSEADAAETPPDITEEQYIKIMQEAADETNDAADKKASATEEDSKLVQEAKPVLVLPAAKGGVPAPGGSDILPTEEVASESATAKLIPDNYFGTEREKKLQQVANGKLIDDWYRERTDTFKEMAKSESQNEQVAAARVLTALGHHDIALPILNAAIDADSETVGPAMSVLGWLPWEKRTEFYARLEQRADNVETISRLVYSMADARDERAADQLWAALKRDDANRDLVYSVKSALARMFSGQSYFSVRRLTPGQKKRIVADAEKRAALGGKSRQLALDLINELDKNKVFELSRQLYESAQTPDDQPVALSYFLLSASKKEANPRAFQALQSESVAVQRIALRFLAAGAEGLPDVGSDSSGSSEGGKPIIPELPEGVTAEMVRPLLASEDAEIRALASYALILLAESDDMRPILQFRPPESRPDLELWQKLTYRAIAFIDDPVHIPWLTKHYEDSKEGYYNFADFYWTIRIMSGPKILALRKRMRDELTMDRINGGYGGFGW